MSFYWICWLGHLTFLALVCEVVFTFLGLKFAGSSSFCLESVIVCENSVEFVLSIVTCKVLYCLYVHLWTLSALL